MNLGEEIRKVFEEVSRDLKGVRGILIATMDGLPVASDVKSTEEENRIAAMVSSLTILARKAAPQLDVGKMQDLLIEADEGKIFCYSVGDEVILALITTKDANLGMIRMKLPRIREKLKDLIL